MEHPTIEELKKAVKVANVQPLQEAIKFSWMHPETIPEERFNRTFKRVLDVHIKLVFAGLSESSTQHRNGYE